MSYTRCRALHRTTVVSLSYFRWLDMQHDLAVPIRGVLINNCELSLYIYLDLCTGTVVRCDVYRNCPVLPFSKLNKIFVRYFDPENICLDNKNK